MDSTWTTGLEVLANGGMKFPHVGDGTGAGSEELNHHRPVSDGYPPSFVNATTDYGNNVPYHTNRTAIWGGSAAPRLPPKGADVDAPVRPTNPLTGANFQPQSIRGAGTAVTVSQPPSGGRTGYSGDFNPTFHQYQVDTSIRAQSHRTYSTESEDGNVPNSQNSSPSPFVSFPVTCVESIVPNNNARKDTSVDNSSVTPFSSITKRSHEKNASGFNFNSVSTIHSKHVQENSIKTPACSRGDETRIVVEDKSHPSSAGVLSVNSMCSPSDIGETPDINTTTATTSTATATIGRPDRRTLSSIDSNTNLDTSNNSGGLSVPPGSPLQLAAVRRNGSNSSAFDMFQARNNNGTKISGQGEKVGAPSSLDAAAKDYRSGSMGMDNSRDSPNVSMDEKLEGDDHYHPHRMVNNSRHDPNRTAGLPPVPAFSDSVREKTEQTEREMWQSIAGSTSFTSGTGLSASAQSVGFPYASSTGQPPTNQSAANQTFADNTGAAKGNTETAASMATAAMGALSSPTVASLPAPAASSPWGVNNQFAGMAELALGASDKKESAAERKNSAEASPTSRSLDTEATASTSTASWVEHDSLPSHQMLLLSAPSSAAAMQHYPDRLPIRSEKPSGNATKEHAFQRSYSWDDRTAAPAPAASAAHHTASSYQRSSSGGLDRALPAAARAYPPVVKARRSVLPQSQQQPSPSRGQTFGQQQTVAQQYQMMLSRGTPPPAMQSWPEHHPQQQQQQQQPPYQQNGDASPSYPHSNVSSPLSSPSLSPRMTAQAPPSLYQEGLTQDLQTGAHYGPPRFHSQRDNTDVPVQHVRHQPSSQSAGTQQQHHHDPFHPHHQQQYTMPSHHMHAPAPSARHMQQHQQMSGYGHHHSNYTATRMGYSSGSVPSSSSGAAMSQHLHPHNLQHHGGGPPTGSPPPSIPPASRSPPEILKTLLRKKACLYEPGTSRAIALATWLVGHRLALTHGYFSRQQLQSGVHAAAASKIESGVITRTKVNRCMQIILNSCFHYIIPRPDGSEERGDVFQKAFAERAVDDAHLLRELPPPWDDVVIDGDLVDSALKRSSDKTDDEDDETPPSSGRGRQVKRRGSGSSADAKDGGGNAGSSAGNKRAVLLCFNENVRSAEDVFRCHNEFIRDAAHSANLQLTTQDWRSFFSGEDVAIVQSAGFGDGVAPRQQQADLPTSMQLPSSSSVFSPDGMGLFEKATPEASSTESSDVLGCMTASELSRFRTTWCSKRYDHDPALCFFAHIDVNRGWLRRDPRIHRYTPQMCPNIKAVLAGTAAAPGSKNKGPGQPASKCFFNVCPNGANCKFAHSKEEIDYHPDRYKKRICNATTASAPPSSRGMQQSCQQRDICPHFHPPGQQHTHVATSPQSKQHYPRHPGQRRGDSPGRGGKRHAAASTGSSSGAGTDQQPSGAPMLYVGPAPESDFEASLMLPGLREIFRRHSSTLYALYCGSSPFSCHYNNFGDDWGLPDFGSGGK